jgi:hypothetical protein
MAKVQLKKEAINMTKITGPIPKRFQNLWLNCSRLALCFRSALDSNNHRIRRKNLSSNLFKNIYGWALAFSFLMLPFSQLTALALTWNSPVTISDLGVDASDPHVGLDANGNAVAIWLEGGLAKASNLPSGGSWSTPVTISNSGASSLRLVVDPNGNATAIWLEAGVVKAVSQPFGGSWSAETILSGTGTATSPNLAVDTSGDVVAVWVQTSTGVSIQSATKVFGGSWPLVVDTISGTTTYSSSPFVSIGANGTVVAVWHSVSGVSDLINSASKTISGGVWGTPLSFFQGTATFSHNYPKVIVDASGNAHAVWFRFNQSGLAYSNVVVLASQLSSGSSTWAIPTMLSITPSLRNPADLYARLAIDTTGDVMAVWTSSYDGLSFNAESAVQLSGKSWNIGGALQFLNLYGLEVDLAANSLGDVVALYMTFDGVSTVMTQAAESDAASSVSNFWTPAQTISSGADNGFPRVAASLTGTTFNACGVWISNNGSNNVIQAATGSQTVILPPSGLSVVQNSTSFGVFTDYNNVVSWTASIDPSVTGYAIYRNGLQFATVAAGTSSVTDNNNTQNGSVTYGVAAFDHQHSQSQIINVSFP